MGNSLKLVKNSPFYNYCLPGIWTKRRFYLLHFLLFMSPQFVFSQALPDSLKADWSHAGRDQQIIQPVGSVQITSFGGSADGLTANDNAMEAAMASLTSGGVINFPEGVFLFTKTINLNSNITLKGAGYNLTTLKFGVESANSHLIHAEGSTTEIQTSFTESGVKGSAQITVTSVAGLAAGDYIRIFYNDASLVTSSWAIGSVGQTERIKSISGQTITIESTLRLHYPMNRQPGIRKILPKRNVGIECLKIDRQAISSDAAVQVSNIHFDKVVQSHILGIESNISSFAHVQLDGCANIRVSESWFHDAVDFGAGGRAYGVLCQLATNLCLISNNIFNDLRHAMILQAGANGNVFAFNFSTDPYRTEYPSDFSGDLVLHGNYVFANLAEGNMVSNIIADDSHGPNGPYNTFLRNRVNGLGIDIVSGNKQNVIGNEVIGYKTVFGQPVPNWYIASTGNTLTGNVVKATDGSGQYQVLDPSTTLADQSYLYSTKPSYLKLTDGWPVFSVSLTPDLSKSNDAAKRYTSGPEVLCEEPDALPVTLTGFTLKSAACSNILNWSSTFESGFSHFIVERSMNGYLFERVGEVAATGSGTGYSFHDSNPPEGQIYYRLQMVDRDGTVTYSRIISNYNDCRENEIFVFPVVTQDQVVLHNLVAGETFSLSNVSGQMLLQKKAMGVEEIIDLSAQPAGVYLIRISKKSGTPVTFRVVKTK